MEHSFISCDAKGAMNSEESDRLRELCMEAQNEMNDEKLIQLIRKINRIFEIAEERVKQAASGDPAQSENDPEIG